MLHLRCVCQVPQSTPAPSASQSGATEPVLDMCPGCGGTTDGEASPLPTPPTPRRMESFTHLGVKLLGPRAQQESLEGCSEPGGVGWGASGKGRLELRDAWVQQDALPAPATLL